ncbi:hypothetical protein BDV37DRAFT_289844 [Aspergillus pseudonomiae]|uniref:Uncharacterized protein n=1 Tax=Aspergillus pseudonomiae TaxID=1506151 RepID=A0A5N7CTC4_9EURO|nr:uncharacterized protein BDV37DRAFT_289844 [Aspergillus pseudonomiae]KAE8396947.1 hypothetical protein BDV37DRAFT_289844 [Aspergillus pseudonomiae]
MEYHQQTTLYPIAEEITPQDHHILRHGGTSSNIERLPSRLRQSKSPPRSLKKQVEDMAYEVSYLKAELLWHAETKQALLQFQDQMYDIFNKMEDALVQVNVRLRDAENRYLEIWGLNGRECRSGEMI